MKSNLTLKNPYAKQRGVLRALHIMKLAAVMVIATVLQANAAFYSPSVETTITLNAQQMQVSGVVTAEEDGAPIVGASVLEKGTSNGVVTDFDGKYSLTVKTGATLVISFVGMQTQEVVVSGATHNVVLKSGDVGLNEVVVTALGIKRQEKTLSYAQQSVGGDELTKTRDVNFMNSLSGKTSGIDIKKSSGGVGGSTKIVLRGNKSLSGVSEPLIVIDGIPMVNNKGGQPGMWGGIDQGDGLSQINPDDIESISILKGSNAAALYGSQGANGVVLITTKKGDAGNTKVTISSGVTFENVLELPDLQFEYGALAGAKESWSYEKGSYDDKFVEEFFQTGYNWINSASISGGNNKTTAYFSYANTASEGIVPNNSYNKNNLSFKQSTKMLKDKVTVTSNIMLTDETVKNRNAAGYYINPLTGLYFFPRERNMADFKNEYQTFNTTRNIYLQNWFVNDHQQSNPYWIINNEPSSFNTKRMIANLSLDYDIMDGLKLQLRGNYDYSLKEFEQQHFAGSNATNVHKNGKWEYQRYTDQLVYGDAILTYNKQIGDLSIGAVLGASYQESIYGVGVSVNTDVLGLRYPNEFNFQNIETSVLVNSTYGSRIIKEAVFANAQIGFKDMIFVDLSGRNDWASTLTGTGNDSYFYPAVGLTAIVSEMLTLPELISFGKVRASYSTVANEVPYNMVAPNHTIGSAGIVMNTAQPFTNLKPEMLTSIEIGTDWRFMESRLGFDFTYYNINSKDQFISLPAPAGSGYTTYYVNAGEIVNTGYELTLNATPVKSGNLQWNTSVNFSSNKNEIVELHPDLSKRMIVTEAEGYQLVINKGGSFGDLYVYKFKRNEAGQLLLDANGKLTKTADMEFVGNSNPDWSLGWNNTVNYKNISFSMLFSGKFGGKVISQTEAMLDGYGVSQRTADARANGNVVKIDGVKPDGTAVTEMDAKIYYTAVGDRNGIKEAYVYDRTNIRLSQLTLSYNIGLKQFGLPIENANLSFVGQNLFFVYKVAPFDPELSMSTTNGWQSLDNFNLPTTRNIGFNLKLTF